NHPGVTDQARDLIKQMYKDHLKSVKYTRETVEAKKGPGEEDEPAILIDPLIAGTPGKPTRDDGIVLALSNGVLYALKRSSGKAGWAVRVGIDTMTLPVRVPARVGQSERILVPSSDTAVLSALDLDGNTLWRYRLGTPSLGRPVVVDQLAYLATEKGDVHEVE